MLKRGVSLQALSAATCEKYCSVLPSALMGVKTAAERQEAITHITDARYLGPISNRSERIANAKQLGAGADVGSHSVKRPFTGSHDTLKRQSSTAKWLLRLSSMAFLHPLQSCLGPCTAKPQTTTTQLQYAAKLSRAPRISRQIIVVH